ncbi:hypothetical protein [Gemmata sp.]|uniref:hypothetical protein n=1 Tax=Gemmata sp. TaxID=1914242 RepID=UPI003F6F4063
MPFETLLLIGSIAAAGGAVAAWSMAGQAEAVWLRAWWYAVAAVQAAFGVAAAVLFAIMSAYGDRDGIDGKDEMSGGGESSPRPRRRRTRRD